MFILTSLFISGKGEGKPYPFPPDTLRFHSNILNEERAAVIYIPENMSLSDSADLLLMLDGEYAGYRLQQLILPERKRPLLAVGILHNDRRKELLPYFEADVFLDFIQQEVLVILEDMFFLKRKIIFGHSFGGATVLYAVQKQCRLFDYYIASSPKPIMELTDCNLYSGCAKEGGKSVFLGYGSRDHRTVIRDCRKLEINLTKCAVPGLSWEIRSFSGLKHEDTPAFTLENALKHFSRFAKPPPGS